MSASPAALRRSRLYSLVARIVILTLLLQGLIPVPGSGTPVAQAGNGDPPLPVTIVEPDAPVLPPEPVVTPAPIVAVRPGLNGVAVSHADEQRTFPPAAQVLSLPPLPVAVTVTVGSPAGQGTPAAPGDLVTVSVTLESLTSALLQGLILETYLPPALQWPGAAGWQYEPRARVVTATLPVLPGYAHITRRFAARLVGLPEGNELSHFVRVIQPGIGERHGRGALPVARLTARSTAGPGGGALVSADGRLRLDVPAGAFTTTVRLEQTWRVLGEMRQDRPAHFFIVSLEAFDVATGAALHRFGAPLSLTLQVGDLLPAGTGFQLEYYDPDLHSWSPASGELRPDPVTGIVQTMVTHFTEYGGRDPSREGWKLLLQDATVSLASGDVRTSYPLAVPPGVNGLQPALSLNYSSGRLNGQTRWVQSDLAGAGWNLDFMEVARVVGFGTAIGGKDFSDNQNNSYARNCAHQYDLCFNDNFTLLFNGTAYPLIPLGDGTYRTEDEAFLKIERLCAEAPRSEPCPPASNQGGAHRNSGDSDRFFDYWRVTTQAGTVYTLGSRADSEQRADRVCLRYNGYDANDPGTWHWCGDAGRFDALGTVVWRWRLDGVEDVYGNRMGYYYTETAAADQGESYGWSGRTDWDRESYLTTIGYNWREDLGWWGYEVNLDLLCRHNAPAACSAFETANINDATADGYGNRDTALWFQRKFLNGIRVRQITDYITQTYVSEGVVVREYRLDYGVSGTRTGESQLPSRVLTRITPYGLDGYSGGHTLPATEFAYTALMNQTGCNGATTYEYGRLTTILNGYGAAISLNYEAPEANLGECWDPGGANLPYPRNWRTYQKTVTDGLTPALVARYEYSDACYADPDDERRCMAATVPGGGFDFTSITGYGVVTETVYSQAIGPANLLSRVEHRFIPDHAEQDWWTCQPNTRCFAMSWDTLALMGREWQVRQLDSQDRVLAATEQAYSSEVLVPRTGTDPDSGKPLHSLRFNHLDETIERQYDAASGALLVQTRSATTYRADIGKPSEQYAYGQTRVLANGGFEGGSTAHAPSLLVPDGWSHFHEAPLEAVALAPVTTPAARVLGAAGLAITHTVGGDCQCGVLQTLTTTQGIVAGTPYVVRARVRTASGTPTFRIWLSDGVNHTDPDPVVPSNDWQLFTQTFTPQAAALLRVRLTLESGMGSVYVDDVWYERLDETGDEQTQKTWYTEPVTTGVAGLPMAVRVYTGTEVLADGQEAALTTYYYDNASGLNEVTLGSLTAESRNHIIAQNWSLPEYRYTTRFGYDAYGNQTVVTDTRGYTSTTAYDPIYHTFPMTFTNALAQQSYLRYDFGLGQVISATNGNGVRTGLIYDAFGRLVKVIEDENDPGPGPKDTALQPTLQYTYTDVYENLSVSPVFRGVRIETVWREASGTPSVKRQLEFYTGRGLLMQTRSEWGQDGSPGQAVVNVAYDALGRVIISYTPVGEGYSTDYTQPITTVAKAQTQYDILGRTVIVTGTDGTATKSYYHGLQTTVLDANGHQKLSITDARGQLVTVKEYTGTYILGDFSATPYATTQYEYSVLGNLTRVTDDQANVTTMSYNALGQKLAMDDPDMGIWGYTYDPAGNLLTQTDAKGAVICFQYDALSQLVAKRYNGDGTCPPSATESYGYDQPGHGYGLGQRTMMTNTNAVVSWVYDRRGRVTAETRRVTGMGVYTTRMDYDTASRVLTTTYPTGEMITHTYTAAWQPARLGTTWRADPYGEANFNVRGQMTTYNHYNNLHTDYAYEEAGATPSFRLAELKLQRFYSDTQYLTFQYEYDNVGNITRLTEATNAGQRQCFGYDGLDRLTSAFTGSDECTTYSARGSAPYDHQGANDYRYDELGSITQLAGRVYEYAGSGHSHAVRYAHKLGGGRYDAFSTSPLTWTLASAQNLQLPYSDAGENVLRHGGTYAASTVYRTDFTLVPGDTIQVEFKTDRDWTEGSHALQVETPNAAQVFALHATPGQPLRLRTKVTAKGTTDTYTPLAPTFHLEANTWYVVRLAIGNYTTGDKFKVWVWQRDAPATRRYAEALPSVWTGSLQWRFRNWANTEVGESPTRVSLDSYFELKGASAGVFSYAYDSNGNMVARTEMGVGYTQAWDEQNRLVAVTYGMTSTLSQYTFGYDADGGRVLQVAPGGYRTAYIGAYEETITPTALFAQDFEAGAGSWTFPGGTWGRYWNGTDGYHYKQTDWEGIGESSAVIAPAVTYGEITATARVRLDLAQNVLAGLALRRDTSNAPAYFVGIRNSASGYYCGIYEKSGSTWTNRTPGLTACKYGAGGWHTLLVRAVSGRIEMHVDGVLITTWVDADATLPLPAHGFGLMTFDGAASFDDIKVYGLATRSYYLFGTARVGERTTTHGQAAGSSIDAGDLYALHSDHLGSVSLATDAWGLTVTLSLARYFPFGAERGAAASGLPTDFAFTGGRGSSFGLVHLGARWYDPYHNQWLSPDSIIPDPANPQSLNRYSYGYNNPHKYTDPTGHCAEEDWACWDLAGELYQDYGIQIEGIWTWEELTHVRDGALMIAKAFSPNDIDSGRGLFRTTFGIMHFARVHAESTSIGGITFPDVLGLGQWNGAAYSAGDYVWLSDNLFSAAGKAMHPLFAERGVAHELGHLWDSRSLGARFSGLHQATYDQVLGDPNGPCPACMGYVLKPGESAVDAQGGTEDWANSFMKTVAGDRQFQAQSPLHYNYVKQQLALVTDVTPRYTQPGYAGALRPH